MFGDAELHRGPGFFKPLDLMNLVDRPLPFKFIRNLQDNFGSDLSGAAEECKVKLAAQEAGVDDDGEARNDSAYDTAEPSVDDKGSEDEEATGSDNGGGEEASGAVLSYCYKDQYWDKDERKYVYKAVTRDTGPYFGNYVLVARRQFDDDDMVYTHTVVDIRGKVLRNALRNIFRGAAAISLTDEKVEISPRFLYWAQPELKLLLDYFNKLGDDASLFEIQTALDFVQEEYGSSIQEFKSLLPHSIDYDRLWALFPPDVLAIGSDLLGRPRIYRVREITHIPRDNCPPYWLVETEYVDFNGSIFGVAEEDFKIHHFKGLRSIMNLPVVPVSIHPNAEAICEMVMDRSQQHVGLCKSQYLMQQYDGHGLVEIDEKLVGYTLSSDDIKLIPYNFRGRIVVDPAILETVKPSNILVPGLRKMRPDRRIARQNYEGPDEDFVTRLLAPATQAVVTIANYRDDDDYLENKPSRGDGPKSEAVSPADLCEEDMLILSGLLYGRSLADDRWGAFDVSLATDINWNTSIIDTLVMESSLKSLIFSTVKAHIAGTSHFDDFVAGKGRGLIGLLYGAPGLGKTLTAEAVAEVARVPLYSVSSGSLGTDAEEVRAALARAFELATHWNAVLLLDEADVFLVRRDVKDMRRNAVVAVFLRELEYYPGILLLTTNKADEIDDAFWSRIHFSHEYAPLGVEARAKIWGMFVERVKRDNEGVEVKVDDKAIGELAEIEINGRQIKNVMSMAVKLATHVEPHVLSLDTMRTAALSQIRSRRIPG